VAKQLQRLRQVKKPDSYDDQKTPAQIDSSEGDSVHLDDALDGVLSQVKRIIHGPKTGNWHDDFISDFGDDASLYNLLQMIDGFDEDRILVNEDYEILVNEEFNVLVGP
jgi:hypothetical protein